MNIDDNTEVMMQSDGSISIKELCEYIAKSKHFRNTLVKCLAEDGIIPVQGD